MSTLYEQLEALRRWISATVGRTIDTAARVETPNGTSPEWSALLAEMRLAPLTDEERADVMRVSQITRGAPLQEIDRVICEIARIGQAEVQRLRGAVFALDSDDPDESRCERLHEKLDRLVSDLRKEVMDGYRSKVLPKRSMFAAARAAALESAGNKGASVTAPSGGLTAFVLFCRNCGGPRLREDRFVCDYCGAQFG